LPGLPVRVWYPQVWSDPPPPCFSFRTSIEDLYYSFFHSPERSARKHVHPLASLPARISFFPGHVCYFFTSKFISLVVLPFVFSVWRVPLRFSLPDLLPGVVFPFSRPSRWFSPLSPFSLFLPVYSIQLFCSTLSGLSGRLPRLCKDPFLFSTFSLHERTFH